MNPLPLSYYHTHDVVQVSRDLLGKVVVTEFNGIRTSGIIVETEAYQGPQDKASHAYLNRRTQRTETMFSVGGVIYVYLCYGIHHLLNIITGPQNVPHGVLIRAIEPLKGVEVMLKRRKLKQIQPNLTAGPGLVTQALGLNRSHNGLSLHQAPIWIEEFQDISAKQIITSTRVGVAYAGEDQFLPWRFRIKGNLWTSPAR